MCWLDVHTEAWIRATRRELAKHESVPGDRIPLPTAPRGALTVAPLAVTGLPGELLVSDEDVAPRPRWTRAWLAAVNRLAPTVMRPHAQPRARVGPVARPTTCLPPDFNSNAALSHFARNGPGAHHLQRRPEGGFIVPMDRMGALPVREPFARFGGDLFLDAQGGVAGIRYLGHWVTPKSPTWPHVAFVFRSSTALWNTVVDHLGLCHFGIANALALATRRHLAPDHPLRRFLKPFVYGTAAINQRCLPAALPKGSLLHRASALTWDGMKQLYALAADGMRYSPFPDDLRARGVHPDQLAPDQHHLFSFSADGLEFWWRIQAFVQRAFTNSISLRSLLTSRRQDQTRAFYDALAADFEGTLPPLEPDGLVRTLIWLLYSVSAFHGHVGSVPPYVDHPQWAAGRVSPDATRADAQNIMQLSLMAAPAALPTPSIGDDFRHLMPDTGSRHAATCLRSDMAELAYLIDTRNAHRMIPVHAFQPRDIPCSVAQ